MPHVTSKDGTAIAYDRFGDGPTLIKVDGTTASRQFSVPLANLLAPHFTVITYNRRGRGDSADTAPYAVEREIEDIAALVDAFGPTAYVLGMSSGAVLALRAAAAGLPIEKVAAYEPPFVVNGNRPPVPENYTEDVTALIAQGKREEALKRFSTVVVGVEPELVEQMRESPFWDHSVSLAHTIPYDAKVMGDTMAGKRLSPEPWSSISIPTLVMTGSETFPWVQDGARELMNHLPIAEYRQLPGQEHIPADDALAPVLVDFFLGKRER